MSNNVLQCFILYSQTQYSTFASAKASETPTLLPPFMIVGCLNIGRVIAQKGVPTIWVESSFIQDYESSFPTSHLSLSNVGNNTHIVIDAHLASTSNPHNTVYTQVTGRPTHTSAEIDIAVDNIGIGVGKEYMTSIDI